MMAFAKEKIDQNPKPNGNWHGYMGHTSVEHKSIMILGACAVDIFAAR